MIASPDVDAALRRIMVGLERPRSLDEWRVRPVASPASPRHGAVSVVDKHGRDIKEAA